MRLRGGGLVTLNRVYTTVRILVWNSGVLRCLRFAGFEIGSDLVAFDFLGSLRTESHTFFFLISSSEVYRFIYEIWLLYYSGWCMVFCVYVCVCVRWRWNLNIYWILSYWWWCWPRALCTVEIYGEVRLNRIYVASMHCDLTLWFKTSLQCTTV